MTTNDEVNTANLGSNDLVNLIACSTVQVGAQSVVVNSHEVNIHELAAQPQVSCSHHTTFILPCTNPIMMASTGTHSAHTLKEQYTVYIHMCAGITNITERTRVGQHNSDVRALAGWQLLQLCNTALHTSRLGAHTCTSLV